MPWKTATTIALRKKQEKILTEYAAGTHTPLHLKTRSSIVLLASQGMANNAIEEKLNVSPHTVKQWRDRYGGRYEELQQTETGTPHKLRSVIETILSDAQRPGAPPEFTDGPVAAITAMACEDPAKYDVPFPHWMPGLLQKEAIKSGIVKSISVRQIGRFLKR
jgi:putative transposase